MKNRGFTLAEILVTLGVIAILAALTMPNLLKALPDKDEENHKKVNYQLEQAITRMINDEGVYPKSDSFNKAGFKNTDPALVKNKLFSGETKFCELLAEQFEKSSGVSCSATDSPDTISFRTTDGMDWYVPKTTFVNGWTTVKVDINGDKIRKGNKINGCSPQKITQNPTQCKKPDLYTYFVRSNGVVILGDSMNSISNDNPTPYSVTFELVCNDTETTNCGSVTLKDASGGVKGTKNNKGGTISNLGTGTYTVSVSPNADFYSNYQNGTRTVVIDGRLLDTKVKVLFAPIEKHCILVNVNDCEGSPTNCASYVVSGVGGMSRRGSSTVMQSCDIPIGNYEVVITPKSGLYIIPVPYNDEGEKISTFTQKVKLGTEDVLINVTFTDQEPPDLVAGVVDLTPDTKIYTPSSDNNDEDDDDDDDKNYWVKSQNGAGRLNCSNGVYSAYCGTYNSNSTADVWAYTNFACATAENGQSAGNMPSRDQLSSILSKYGSKDSSIANKWFFAKFESSDHITTLVMKYNTSSGAVEQANTTKTTLYTDILCVP